LKKWIKVKLSDLGNVVGGATPSTLNEEYYGGNIAWITPKDLSNFEGRFISHGERNITKLGLKSCSTTLLPKNTVLFTSRAPIGYVAISSNELATNQGFKSIVPNDNTDYLFLYYLLKYNKDKIEGMGSGTTFKEVSGATMKNIEVRVPQDKEEQIRIGKILSSLDDKIEQNTRMNKVLEEIARALFRRWFVAFEFPDNEGQPYKSAGGKMVESEMGSVPEGWRVGNIGDICYRKRNLVEPISLGEQLPYVGLEHMPQHHMVLDRWGSSGDIMSTKISFTENDILFGTLRPYFHKVGLSPINGICSTDILVCSPIDPEYLSLVLCYLSSDEFVAYSNSASEGTRMPRAKWDHMKKYSVVIPSEEIIIQFNVIINSILSQIKENINMNCCLKEIQNNLLPKLMSGEIEV